MGRSRRSTTPGGRSWPMPGMADERAPAMRLAVSWPQAMGTSVSASPCSTSVGAWMRASTSARPAVGADGQHLPHHARRADRRAAWPVRTRSRSAASSFG